MEGLDGGGKQTLYFFSFFISFSAGLDARRVQHDTDAAAHGDGGEVGPEHSVHEAGVSVNLADLTPCDVGNVVDNLLEPSNEKEKGEKNMVKTRL